MSKKHDKKWYKPQNRNRLKKTVGQLKLIDVVVLAKEKTDDGENIFAACSCGWRSSSEATTLVKVGREAKEHVNAGECRLAHHTDDEVGLVDQIFAGETDTEIEPTSI